MSNKWKPYQVRYDPIGDLLQQCGWERPRPPVSRPPVSSRVQIIFGPAYVYEEPWRYKPFSREWRKSTIRAGEASEWGRKPRPGPGGYRPGEFTITPIRRPSLQDFYRPGDFPTTPIRRPGGLGRYGL